MVQRNFHVSAWIRPLDFWNLILPGGKMHQLSVHDPDGRDTHGWLEQAPVKMAFLTEEDARAKAWLRRQGWQEGDLFVCLLVRDNKFLSTLENTDPPRHSENSHYDPKIGYGWNHLNYRDTDIKTYVPAAEWLADQRVWVLRMGKAMANPIQSSHPHIIDYAFHPEKSDFLDIWLFAHCDFCITTGTGIDIVCDIYRKPTLFLNFIPLINAYSWSNAIHLSKNLIWQKSRIPLTLREYFVNYGEYYDRMGIRVIDLTPEEILAAVQEQWQRLQGVWVDTDDDLWRHRRFWEILKTHPDYDKLHGWIHPESRASAMWLRSKGEEFFK
jgi:putative glycosyltransferase (TIGR04372 family)